MGLELPVGDLVMLNNRFWLHGRAGFEKNPELHRELLRRKRRGVRPVVGGLRIMYDYVIIGGGIVGLSTAYALMQKYPPHAKMVIVEKERQNLYSPNR